MKHHVRTILPVLAALSLSSCTPVLSTSALLSREMARLDSLGVRPSNPEYVSLRETAARGEALLAGGDDRQAEELFRLALVKIQLLAAQPQGEAPSVPEIPLAPPTVVTPPPPPEQVAQNVPLSTVPDPEPTVAAVPLPPVVPPAGAEPPPVPEAAPPIPETEASVPEAVAPVPAAADNEPVPSPVAGGDIRPETVYVVKKGDSLWSVSRKTGVGIQQLARQNRMTVSQTLFPGQKLRLSLRRIVPKTVSDGLVINIADRTLYYFKGGALASTSPVAVGRPRSASDSGWETPTGSFRITAKLSNPSWYVPASIQKEMQSKGQEVIKVVPAGPENPLGKYVLRTTIRGIMIHGTNKPSSINSFSSHGCVRVLPEQMEELFQRVPVNAPGEIIYQPVKVARSADGHVFLEVHRDVYGKIPDLAGEVRKNLRSLQVDRQVDWKKIKAVITDKSGVAEDVTL